jgi:hypothetical protein
MRFLKREINEGHGELRMRTFKQQVKCVVIESYMMQYERRSRCDGIVGVSLPSLLRDREAMHALGLLLRAQVQTVPLREPGIENQRVRLHAHFILSSGIASVTKPMQASLTW